MTVSADDLKGLLAAWLTELARLADADGFIPERVTRLELEGSTLEAAVAGQRGVPAKLIRHVTCRRLDMEDVGGEWHAHVVLGL